MKQKQILLLFLLFNFVINDDNKKVINACGAGDFIKNYTEPNKQEDCKDPNEGCCKFVTINYLDGNKTRFCAIIHGDFDDTDVLDEVADIIKVKNITVEDSKYLIGRNAIIYYIFFYILIFLF